jgi:uncharacterized membrane protein
MHSVDVLAIVMAGLMVGNELTVSLFINPVIWRLDPIAQTRALSMFAGILGRIMPVWYAICLVLIVAETVVRRAQPGFASLLAASLLWAGVILFTVFTLVPINNRIAVLAVEAPLDEWLPAHKRWDKLHRLRIALLIAALVLLVHGLLLSA